MTNYGKKFIQYLFARRAKCDQVRYELESRVQADSDRSDIRMFEARIPAQRYGDNEQSERNAASTESIRLIEIAKANDLFIPKTQWETFGDRKRLPSGESIVYLSRDGKYITKVRNPFAKAAIKQLRATDIIYEHLVHNILFPSTHYTFVGISEDIDGIRIILRQNYIPLTFISPSQKQIDKYIQSKLGLANEGYHFYGNNYISITDVVAEGDNVLIGDGDILYFIDPIIRLKKPALQVLDYYYSMLI